MKACVTCGAPVPPQRKFESQARFARRVYCSQLCAVRTILKKRMTPMRQRFEEKVDKNGPIPSHCPELGRCWVWMGQIAHGYGRFRYELESLAHRVSYILYVGPIPEGLKICHHCDNKACVNSVHVYAGTTLDNSRDRWARCKRRISLDNIVVLKALVAIGMPKAAVARSFGLSSASVGYYVLRRQRSL